MADRLAQARSLAPGDEKAALKELGEFYFDVQGTRDAAAATDAASLCDQLAGGGGRNGRKAAGLAKDFRELVSGWEYAESLSRPQPQVASVAVEQIEILTGKPERAYTELGRIHARASAPTAFARAPNLDEVNGKLREKAAQLGANAVIGVTYDRGVDPFSWKALHADGVAVRMESDEKVCPYCAETIKAAAVKCRFCGSDPTMPPVRSDDGPAAT